MSDAFFAPDDQEWQELGDRLDVYDPITSQFSEVYADFTEVTEFNEEFSNVKRKTVIAAKNSGLMVGQQIEWMSRWYKLTKRDTDGEFSDVYELTTCSKPVVHNKPTNC